MDSYPGYTRISINASEEDVRHLLCFLMTEVSQLGFLNFPLLNKMTHSSRATQCFLNESDHDSSFTLGSLPKVPVSRNPELRSFKGKTNAICREKRQTCTSPPKAQVSSGRLRTWSVPRIGSQPPQVQLRKNRRASGFWHTQTVLAIALHICT